ncbi:MAG: hypothetical protein ACHQ2F_07305 [Desulfobaccales bacterium]
MPDTPEYEYFVLPVSFTSADELKNLCDAPGAGGWILSTLVPLDNSYLAVFYKEKIGTP